MNAATTGARARAVDAVPFLADAQRHLFDSRHTRVSTVLKAHTAPRSIDTDDTKKIKDHKTTTDFLTRPSQLHARGFGRGGGSKFA